MPKLLKRFRQNIALKSLSGMIILLIVFFVFAGAVGYRGFTDMMLEQYAEGAFLTADAAAVTVVPDRMENYARSRGESSEYQYVFGKLERVCNSSGATFIYIIQPDLTDYKHITFLFSTANKNTNYTIYDFGYVRETTNDEYRMKYKALYEGISDHELVIRDKGYIETDAHITAMVPLIGSDGETKAILCVQRQMDALLKGRTYYLINIFVILLILVVIVVIVEGLYLKRILLNPIRIITGEAARFAEENQPGNQKLADVVQSQDEIGTLALSIDQMEEQIVKNVENMTRITAERERIRTEMSLAARIQSSMIPDVFPPFPEHSEFDLYASMNPAREIGGDFYDFILIDDDHLCLSIADVSGKGIPAALFMMVSKLLLADNAKMKKTPADILESVNNLICVNNRANMFITVWLGILELSTGILRAANAGHEYPLLYASDHFEVLKDKHALMVGALEGTRYFNYEIRMEPGWKLFLYTDGLPEASDPDHEMFGIDRVLQLLNDDPDTSPKEILEHVNQEVQSFVKDAEQFDDLTMMCLEYKGNKEGS